MCRRFLIIFLLGLTGCTNRDQANSATHSNRYLSLFSHPDQSDSVIVITNGGKKYTLPSDTGEIGPYPSLYNDRIISLLYNKGTSHADLVTVDPASRHSVIIAADMEGHLTTDVIHEYPGKAVVIGVHDFFIADVESRKVLAKESCEIGNVLITDSGYFVVKHVDFVKNQLPDLFFTKDGTNRETRLCALPDMHVHLYQDATTYHWNGMFFDHGFLIIQTLQHFLAIDVRSRQIVDQIGHKGAEFYLMKNAGVTKLFSADGSQRIEFNYAKGRFKRI